MLHHAVPVGFGDFETGMHGLHVSTGVFARPAGGHAQEIHHVLAHFVPGIGPQADKKAAQLRVGRKMAKEVVRDGS